MTERASTNQPPQISERRILFGRERRANEIKIGNQIWFLKGNSGIDLTTLLPGETKSEEG